MNRMNQFIPMIQHANTKEVFKQNIMGLNVEELRSFINKPEMVTFSKGTVQILKWMIVQNDNIPDFENKFRMMVAYYKKNSRLFLGELTARACSCLRGNSLSMLLEAGCDINSKNLSNQNECLVATLYPYKNINRSDEETEQLQKNILRILIRNGIRLDFLQKDENNRSFYESICSVEKYYFLDWIDSFYDEFNEEQKKEWKTVRLQRLF